MEDPNVVEDETVKKKKKFSFLNSLGFKSESKPQAESKVPTPDEKKQNKFYVGNAADAIISRKKMLESIPGD